VSWSEKKEASPSDHSCRRRTPAITDRCDGGDSHGMITLMMIWSSPLFFLSESFIPDEQVRRACTSFASWDCEPLSSWQITDAAFALNILSNCVTKMPSSLTRNVSGRCGAADSAHLVCS
jgi:hypothetical protein